MKRLAGKVAIITGASSGIGRAAAKIFSAQGAKLVVCGRRADMLDDLVSEIVLDRGRAVALAGDVRDEKYIKAVVDLAVTEYGGLDIAFNNAGTLGVGGDICALSESDWLEVMNTNLTSAFLCAKHQIPEMLKRGAGSIIFTSTFVGSEIGLSGMAAYGASKSGLTGLARVLASEYGPQNIRVNILSPGGTDTPMTRSFIGSPETQQFVESIHALKRMARPDEIANVALFLASDESSFVTGASIYADGGVSICKG